MTEEAARFWDSVAKMITAVGLVAGGLWAAWKYFAARQRERQLDRDARTKEIQLAQEKAKSAEVEARKPFSEKQLELYFQAVEAASLLATLPKSHPAYGAVSSDFWKLYWGALALVEDQLVANAMFNFGEAAKGDAPPDLLQGYALKLAHACRDSLAESWKVSLPVIEKSISPGPDC